MNPLQLTTFINSVANYIASQVDEENLALLSAVFTQLGDTLNTISIIKKS